MTAEYGLVANVAETDSALRLGAKVWIVHAWTGGGYERVTVWGMARNGRRIEKWVPIWRLHNFRAAWLPEKVRAAVSLLTVEGSQEAMDQLAAALDRYAAEERATRPDRFTGHQVAEVRQ